MRLRPDWSAAWAGATVVVAASGPSQRRADLDYARTRGARVVAINSTWRLAPRADMLFACDADWWKKCGPGPDEFAGRRVVGKVGFPGAWFANVVPSERMIWDGERLGGGHNSSFQALNLMAIWAVRRVIFLGLDCQMTAPGVAAQVHWHGPHERRPNPNENNFFRWRQFFDRAAPEIAARGVEVVNASRSTALECFPRMPIEEALP